MIGFNNVAVRRGPRKLLDHIDLRLHAGQRVGVVGRHGTGKSSLFALIVGELAADAGDIDVPARLDIATVGQQTPAGAQPAIEFVLDGDAELRASQRRLEAAESRADAQALTELHARMAEIDGYAATARAARLLHGLGFAPATHGYPIDAFSGGWRMRLNLAAALIHRADLFLLDEPTNHLDLEMRHALELALQDFAGAAVLIAHDRHLIDATCEALWRVDDGALEPFHGDLADYGRWLSRQRANTEGAARASPLSPARAAADNAEAHRDAAQRHEHEKPLRRALKQAEQRMARLEERITALEGALAKPSVYGNRTEVARLAHERGRLRKQREAAEAAWIENAEALDAAGDGASARVAT